MAYATLEELTELGLPAAALNGVTTQAQQKALDAASTLADGYLAGRFVLPLTSWGDDLRSHVCAIASWKLLSGNRGFNPERGSDVAVRTNYDDAIEWLKAVNSSRVNPVGIVDSEPVTAQGPVTVFVSSTTKRGW